MAWWKYLCCLCLFAQEPEQPKNTFDRNEKQEKLLNRHGTIAQEPEQSTTLLEDDTGSLIGDYYKNSWWDDYRIGRWIDKVQAGSDAPKLANIETSGCTSSSRFYNGKPFANQSGNPTF